jgi:hypothetical protein
MLISNKLSEDKSDVNYLSIKILKVTVIHQNHVARSPLLMVLVTESHDFYQPCFWLTYTNLVSSNIFEKYLEL